MLNRPGILALIPHQGASCLLDEVEAWDAARISCRSRSHLDPSNPLRREGRLAGLCGAEYGMQAAALHGALVEGRPQRAGYVAALSHLHIVPAWLDSRAFGTLRVEAAREHTGPNGLVYNFRLLAEGGALLVEGSAIIALPALAREALAGGE